MGQHDAGAFLRSFASYVIVNISRDLNSSVLISSERAHTRSIESVIESIIDLDSIIAQLLRAPSNY